MSIDQDKSEASSGLLPRAESRGQPPETRAHLHEISDAVIDVFEIDPPTLRGSVVSVEYLRDARVCFIILAREHKYNMVQIGDALEQCEKRSLSRLVSDWVSPQKNQWLGATRKARLVEARNRVCAKVDLREHQRILLAASRTEAIKTRNDSVRRLRKIGWTIKGIAKHLELDAVTVCDVLGEDRCWARRTP